MRHNHPKVILAIACLALLLAGAAANAANLGQELTSQSAIEQVLRRGVLRVGMSTFEPWAMKDKDGQFMGYEVDVANRLAQDMGMKLELVHTQWSGIIPALLTGKFDMIIGGMSIRPDRALKVNFSIPYNVTGMSLVAHRQKAQGFSSLEDFNKPGVVIATRTGTTAAQAVQKYLPKANVRLFDSEPQALQELLNGNAHAFVSTAPKPAFEAIAHKDRLFLPFSGTFTSEPNAIAVRKGDPDTLNYLDSWIRSVAAEGWFAERYTYWFETRDWANRLP